MFREITINAVANGWIVQVGCQRFVYDETQALIKDLHDYLVDPVLKESAMLHTCRNIKWVTPSNTGVSLLDTNQTPVDSYSQAIRSLETIL